MKRKLSLLLALVMILSLVPMSAFAASDNSVDKTPKVADDHAFDVNGDAPKLRVEEKNDNFGTNGQTFRLKLENAEWLGDSKDPSKLVIKSSAALANADQTLGNAMGAVTTRGTGLEFFMTRLTDTTVEVTVYGVNGASTDDEAIEIPMYAELQGKGEAKVIVEPRDSTITGGTYVFAIGGSGDTVSTVDSIKTFSDFATLADLEIDETSVGAISKAANQKIKLKLPSDFEFKTTPVAGDIEFKGGLAGSVVGKTTGTAIVKDGRTLEIYYNSTAAVGGTRGTIYVKNLVVTATKDADYGEVELNVSGDDITTEDIVVAKYSDYDVTVKADGDPKQLIAGEFEGATDDAHKLQTLIIQEEVPNAWMTDRKTRVEFPSWVKILSVDVTSDSDKIDASALKTDLTLTETDRGDNYVEFTVAKTGTAAANPATGKAKAYLKFFVSVEANASGDITAEVSGRALAESYEVVLGKAVAPVNVKVDAANVRTGIKEQPLNEITITEGVKEALIKGDLVVTLEDGEWTDTPAIKVAEGNVDLDVDGAKVDGPTLTIPVKSDSSKPATIKISGAEIDLNRSIAEGDIDVKVGGSAIVRNYYDKDSDKLDKGFFKQEFAAKAVVARVITPADGNTKAGEAVKFTIDGTTYKVGDVEKTMDVAPYIKDGRTMMPIRFVADAVGVNESNIIWNNDTRTVVIIKGDRVASIVIGSNVLTVNGTEIPMDVAAEIKDGRTMLPLRFVAQALGAQVAWDEATRTVTVQ